MNNKKKNYFIKDHKMNKLMDSLLDGVSQYQSVLDTTRFERIVNYPVLVYFPWLLEKFNIGHRVQVKTFWGEYMEVILPEKISSHIWRYGYFEEKVALFLINQLSNGMTVLDIGAHFGFFSLLSSFLVGRNGIVKSFEPTPSTFKQLYRNTANHSNIEIFHYAILDENVNVEINDFGLLHSAWNSLGNPRNKGWEYTENNKISVQAKSIDSFLDIEKDIDLIKIDVESSEMAVLRGMKNLLSSQKPNLIIEVGDFGSDNMSNSKNIILWLKAIGYSPYEICENKIVKHEIRNKYLPGNLLFIAE